LLKEGHPDTMSEKGGLPDAHEPEEGYQGDGDRDGLIDKWHKGSAAPRASEAN